MRHMLAVGAAGVVLMLLGMATATAADDKAAVGTLGDAATMSITGCRTIKVDEVRQAIGNDAMLQVASSPSAPLDAYLRLLEKSLLRGCRASGYPDAKVAVAVSESPRRIDIAIDEGPRYKCGAVRVIDAGPIDVKLLLEHLTTIDTAARFPATIAPDGTGVKITGWDRKTTERAKANWTEGDAANFADRADKQLAYAVRNALMEQGYFWSSLEAKLDRTDGHRADLVIRITDPGPKAQLGYIRIKGLTRHTREQILNHLHISDGLAVDLQFLQSCYEKLWSSGRFYMHDLELAASPDERGGAILSIDLAENTDAPLLDEPLSELEQAALNMAAWLNGPLFEQDDLVFTIDDPIGRAQFIGSKSHGILARLLPANREDAEIALHFATDRTAFYDPAARACRITAQNPRIPKLTIGITPRPPEPGNPEWGSSAAMGMAVSSGSKKGPVSVFRASMVPACAIQTVHRYAEQTSIENGVLRIMNSASTRLEADARTGRIRQLFWTDPTEPKRTIEFRFEPGAAERALAKLDEQTPDRSELGLAHAMVALAPRSVDLLVALIPNAFGMNEADRREGVKALVALSADVGRRLEAIAPKANDDPDFTIPADLKALFSRGLSGFYTAILPICDELFVRGTWTWTLSRQVLFALASENEHFSSEMRRLYASPEVGPLGCYAAAYLMRGRMAGPSVAFANHGLDRLDDKHFVADCRVLFDGDAGQPQIIRTVLEALAAQSPEQLDALSKLIDPAYRKSARQAMQIIHDAQGKPFVQNPDAQAELWNKVLRPILLERLKAMVQPPASVAAVP